MVSFKPKGLLASTHFLQWLPVTGSVTFMLMAFLVSAISFPNSKPRTFGASLPTKCSLRHKHFTLIYSASTSEIHPHFWAAVFLGGAICLFPLVLIWKWPGDSLAPPLRGDRADVYLRLIHSFIFQAAE